MQTNTVDLKSLVGSNKLYRTYFYAELRENEMQPAMPVLDKYAQRLLSEPYLSYTVVYGSKLQLQCLVASKHVAHTLQGQAGLLDFALAFEHRSKAFLQILLIFVAKHIGERSILSIASEEILKKMNTQELKWLLERTPEGRIITKERLLNLLKQECYSHLISPCTPINATCSICLEPPVYPARTACNHIFCTDCITRWIDCKTRTCPYCRSSL